MQSDEHHALPISVGYLKKAPKTFLTSQNRYTRCIQSSASYVDSCIIFHATINEGIAYSLALHRACDHAAFLLSTHQLPRRMGPKRPRYATRSTRRLRPHDMRSDRMQQPGIPAAPGRVPDH
eukprot:7387671-Prymnesium_polylepis.3